MKLSFAFAALAVIAGCSPKPATWPSPEQLDAVVRTCGAPREWLHIGSDGRPQLIVPQDAAYGRIACLHRELEKQGAPAKTGLIQEPSR
ncbi:hypothetical protein SGCZBJ_15170 [Caulobacter zeae]|uniref:Lipoprotein n=1 Tax=Caulobacter zeae TaxID=2055137 RepID=A0A2N5DD72_9CAUL|nr:hypothetical protein [Caulobacter zeae]PLR23916.1 hypothetical protein SGCZBJ_15170 [Caulobacter zeae]